MHPAAIVGIIVGGIVCIWGGYEAGTHILDWISCRREQRQYEQYIRDYHEKQVLLQDESDDDDDGDDKPLAHSTSSSHYLSSSSVIRQRNNNNNDNNNEDDLLQHRGNSLMGFIDHDDDDDEDNVKTETGKVDASMLQHELPAYTATSSTNNMIDRVPSRDRTPSDVSSSSKTSWTHAHLADDDDEPSSLDGSSFGVLSLSSASYGDDANDERLRT